MKYNSGKYNAITLENSAIQVPRKIKNFRWKFYLIYISVTQPIARIASL